MTETRRNNLVFLSLMVVSLLSSSCLRYVPSRSDKINEASSENGAASKSQYLGKKAFYSLEKRQRARLSKLLKVRSQGLGLSPESSYKIGPGDELEFVVFDVEELNRTVRVRPSGMISLPLIGQIRAAGLSEEQIQNLVSTRLNEFVYSPSVQVIIKDYSAHKVSVIGAVNNPGSYALRRDNYSLIELLSEAGGRAENASNTIMLIPAVSTSPKVLKSSRGRLGKTRARYGIEIDFNALVGTLNSPPLHIPLRSGDTIMVPEAGSVQVFGEVNKPGSQKLVSGMTLLGSVASAGGLTYSADVSKVEVVRELGSRRKAMIAVDIEELAEDSGNDIRLRSGDVVRVPSSPGRFATRQVVDSLNRLFSFGLNTTVGP